MWPVEKDRAGRLGNVEFEAQRAGPVRRQSLPGFSRDGRRLYEKRGGGRRGGGEKEKHEEKETNGRDCIVETVTPEPGQDGEHAENRLS